MKNLYLVFALLFILSLSSASAMIVYSVSYDPLAPGSDSNIVISIKNTLDSDVKDISLSLDLTKLISSDPSRILFSAIGSSEDSVSDIAHNKIEDFYYTIKASSDVKPGDYSIPYVLTYTVDNESQSRQTKTGAIGISVSASPIIEYSVSADNPVVGQQGKINVKIVNKGLADAKFVTLKIIPDGMDLLSADNTYIGTISSDDFQSASFDVIFKRQDALVSGIVEYNDFNNKLIKQNFNIPIEVYSEQKAYELGILKRSYISYYIGAAILLIIIWFIWRSISKRRRIRKSMQAKEG